MSGQNKPIARRSVEALAARGAATLEWIVVIKLRARNGIAMAQVIDKRVTAEIEGGFVVFLIGMRINKFRKACKSLPIFFAMSRILRELEQRPEAGFLGASRLFRKPTATDARPVLALLRAPGDVCAQSRRGPLARLS